MPEAATLEPQQDQAIDPAVPPSEVSTLRPALPEKAPAPDPKAAAEREARQLAKFEAIKNGQPVPRDQKGRFATKEETAPLEKPPEPAASGTTPADRAAPPKAQDAKPDDQKSHEPDPEAVKAARRALLRDEWEVEDVDALPIDKLLKLGSTRAKAQEKLDRRFTELKAGAPASAPAAKTEPEPSGGLLDSILSVDADPTNGTAAKATGTDPEAEVSSVLELLDDEHSAKVKSALEKERAATQRALQIANRATEAALSARIHGARDRLASEFGAVLQDPKDLDAVFRTMGQLDPEASVLFHGSTADLDKLMRRAVLAEFGDTLKQQSHAARVAQNRAARSGSPEVRTGPTASPGGRTPTAEDRMKAKFQAITEVGASDQAAIKARTAQILSGAST